MSQSNVNRKPRHSPPPRPTLSTPRTPVENPKILLKKCQCDLVNPYLVDRMTYSCQWKVNAKMMEMEEYYKICKKTIKMVTVSGDEKERLKKVWNERGYKWEVDENTREIKFLR